MAHAVQSQDYGKSDIQFLTVRRSADAQELREIFLSIQFEGDFVSVFSDGDNSQLLPTGTMVNTAYALGHDYLNAPLDEYACAVADRLLAACPAATAVCIHAHETPWQRLTLYGWPHPHSFADTGGAQTGFVIRSERDMPPAVQGSLSGLRLLKTTRSSFTGFLRDEFTTVAPQKDRVMGAELDLTWDYQSRPDDSRVTVGKVLAAVREAFCEHTSASGQQTLFVLGTAALRACPEVARIHLTCRARDHVEINLEPFGRVNQGQIYVAPHNPYSLVHLTVNRE
ncbi:factor-independent urate hydroxylase [Streptomyces sp. NPDC127051]|uniref:factor-independent urate hydroxylase n=1 Tax=Streptomyces sp. NPDC127051 TaxID=3347119 RepID=UPI00364DC4CB